MKDTLLGAPALAHLLANNGKHRRTRTVNVFATPFDFTPKHCAANGTYPCTHTHADDKAVA